MKTIVPKSMALVAFVVPSKRPPPIMSPPSSGQHKSGTPVQIRLHLQSGLERRTIDREPVSEHDFVEAVVLELATHRVQLRVG